MGQNIIIIPRCHLDGLLDHTHFINVICIQECGKFSRLGIFHQLDGRTGPHNDIVLPAVTPVINGKEVVSFLIGLAHVLQTEHFSKFTSLVKINHGRQDMLNKITDWMTRSDCWDGKAVRVMLQDSSFCHVHQQVGHKIKINTASPL